MDGATTNFGCLHGIIKQLFGNINEAVYCFAHDSSRITEVTGVNPQKSKLPVTTIMKVRRLLVALATDFSQSTPLRREFESVQREFNERKYQPHT